MQPFLSQAMLTTRIAEMHREAADRAARSRPQAARRRAQRARTQVRPATAPAVGLANPQQARSVHANRVTHAGRTGG